MRSKKSSGSWHGLTSEHFLCDRGRRLPTFSWSGATNRYNVHILNRQDGSRGRGLRAGLKRRTIRQRFRKSICSVAFPPKMPVAEKFTAAKATGFEGIELRMGDEMPLDSTPDHLSRLADAAQEAGITVVRLWDSSLSAQSPAQQSRPALRAKGVEAIRQAIDFAQSGSAEPFWWPFNPGHVGYGSQSLISATRTPGTASPPKSPSWIPDAEQRPVCTLTMENVWNKVSAAARSKCALSSTSSTAHGLQSHFEYGQRDAVRLSVYWIQTLGSRIKRIHVKDYKLSAKAAARPLRTAIRRRRRFQGCDAGSWLRSIIVAFLSPEYGYEAA